MPEKRRYRQGEGRLSETKQPEVLVGDVDRMSLLARDWSMEKCGHRGRCTRPAGHDEIDGTRKSNGTGSSHPSRKHVAARFPGAVCERTWW